jgi:hypothetical protein
MMSFAERLVAFTPVGFVTELPRAGTALESPFVFDAAAREIKQFAERGKVAIVEEDCVCSDDGQVISRLSFQRLS